MDLKVFDTLLEGVFLINADKKVIYANEPAALHADISLRKILRQGPALDELFRFEDFQIPDLSSVQDASPYVETKATNQEGRALKVQVTIQPFPASPDPTWLVYFRDVSLEETLQRKYRGELEQKESVIEDLKKAQEELQNYSKNLEKMVEERSFEILQLNRQMQALLNSLQSGFLIFNEKGLCSTVYSAACETVLECKPAGLHLGDVLKFDQKEKLAFDRWLQTVYSEMLPFEDLAPLGPQRYPHSQNKVIQLNHYPIRNEDGKIDSLVLMATDISDLVAAQAEAELERQNVKMLMNMIKSRKDLMRFLVEAHHLLESLSGFESRKDWSKEEFDEVFRYLHTLKGGAATYSLQKVSDACHTGEDLVNEIRRHQKTELWPKLQEQLRKVKESLQAFELEFHQIIGQEKSQQVWIEKPLNEILEQIDPLPWSPKQKTEFIDFLKSVPAQELVQGYIEMAPLIASQLGKESAPLSVKGGQIYLSADRFQTLFSTLVHALRNSLDHGIEEPDFRESLGKSRAGNLYLEIEKVKKSDSSHLRIHFWDDGRGINVEKLRSKLQESRDPLASAPDSEVLQAVFRPSLSLKEEVTNMSGRGVGMDAIASESKKLGGKAWVESTPNQGTHLFIEVPWMATETVEEKSAA